MNKIDPRLTNKVGRSAAILDRKMHALDWSKNKKGEAIKASAQASKQSNTPSTGTKCDQVKSSIAKYSGRKPSSSVNRPVTRSQTKKLFTRLIKLKLK